MGETVAQKSADKAEKEASAPLNLSADTAEDKRIKRPAETDNSSNSADLLAKRVKSEQTEATDLSMKPSSNNPSQQNSQRLGNHSVCN